ncbi:MAG: YdcF family protein [Candidatus Saganbacteria bacterium]|nr:YdcF family protein [Candidatus Saganbacteria bacterium]
MAGFLIVQDDLKKADAIIVLSGDGNGERMEQGAKLYKDGYAKYVLISGGQLYWKITYADIIRQHAESLGVPRSAILVEDRSESTYENAKLSIPALVDKKIKSIILVTSPTHTRRAIRTFRRLFNPAGIEVIVYPVQKSRFSKKGWWRRHEDTQLVVFEYIKLIGYVFKGL